MPDPAPIPEPQIPASGGGALRTTVYALLALGLVAGAWVRFDAQIAAVSPALAGPAAPAAERVMLAGQPKVLAELDLLPAASAQAAVATMALSSTESTALATDLRRDRLRLVRLPLFDAGAGTGPLTVLVSSGGFSQVLHLTRQPTVLTLPIDRVGTVSFQLADSRPASEVGIGMLTRSGPLTLHGLGVGDVMDVGIVAQ